MIGLVSNRRWTVVMNAMINSTHSSWEDVKIEWLGRTKMWVVGHRNLLYSDFFFTFYWGGEMAMVMVFYIAVSTM
jgi:hypothetical protein